MSSVLSGIKRAIPTDYTQDLSRLPSTCYIYMNDVTDMSRARGIIAHYRGTKQPLCRWSFEVEPPLSHYEWRLSPTLSFLITCINSLFIDYLRWLLFLQNGRSWLVLTIPWEVFTRHWMHHVNSPVTENTLYYSKNTWIYEVKHSKNPFPTTRQPLEPQEPRYWFLEHGGCLSLELCNFSTDMGSWMRYSPQVCLCLMWIFLHRPIKWDLNMSLSVRKNDRCARERVSRENDGLLSRGESQQMGTHYCRWWVAIESNER